MTPEFTATFRASHDEITVRCERIGLSEIELIFNAGAGFVRTYRMDESDAETLSDLLKQATERVR